MSVAVEFLNGPRILLLRLYAPWRAAERRTAVKNVKFHGCYRSGIPLLIDSTEVAPDAMPDVGALRAALASSLRDSRIAIVVSPLVSTAGEPFTLGGAVFTSRIDALRWLAVPVD